MSALHHLLRRSAGALALVLAFAVLVGSLCPRGWFVCVHDEAFVLVDGHHANEQSTCGEEDCCPADDNCLDLALSLVLDDQTVALPMLAALPSGPVISSVPNLTAAALNACTPLRAVIGGPPPSPFVSHVCLLV